MPERGSRTVLVELTDRGHRSAQGQRFFGGGINRLRAWRRRARHGRYAWSRSSRGGDGAHSSAEEHSPYKRGATGSIPVAPTKFPQLDGGSAMSWQALGRDAVTAMTRSTTTRSTCPGSQQCRSKFGSRRRVSCRSIDSTASTSGHPSNSHVWTVRVGGIVREFDECRPMPIGCHRGSPRCCSSLR
jgi:hypothetical protein